MWASGYRHDYAVFGDIKGEGPAAVGGPTGDQCDSVGGGVGRPAGDALAMVGLGA